MGRKNWKRAQQVGNGNNISEGTAAVSRAYEQRNSYHPRDQRPGHFSSRPPFPQQQHHHHYQQSSSNSNNPPTGPRSVDSGWRGQPPPTNPSSSSSNTNTNHSSNQPSSSQNVNGFKAAAAAASSSSHDQHQDRNRPQQQHQGSSYHPSNPSTSSSSAGGRATIPASNNQYSNNRYQSNFNKSHPSTSRNHYSSYESNPSRDSPPRSSNENNQPFDNRRPLDSNLDDRRKTDRDDLRLPTPDSPRRNDFQSSRRYAGDSPRREKDAQEDSKSSAGGSIKGKERDRGDYYERRSGAMGGSGADSKGSVYKHHGRRDFEDGRSRSRAEQRFNNNEPRQRNWKRENSIGGYGKGRSHHAAFSPPRNGGHSSSSALVSSSPPSKDDRNGGRSRRKRSRSISDISSSPRSPDCRRRRKRSSSRSRERENDQSDSGGGGGIGSYRRNRGRDKSRDKDKVGDGGGGSSASWRDRRGDSRTRSISPILPDRPSAMSRDRDRYQVRDDIEKARAQVRERDAAVQREKKEQERLQRLKEEEELEKIKLDHRHHLEGSRDQSVQSPGSPNSPSSPRSPQIPSSDHQGRVLQRKESLVKSNLNDSPLVKEKNTTIPTQPRAGGWTVIRESRSEAGLNGISQESLKLEETKADAAIVSTNGIHQDSDMVDISKDEAPSEAMLAAMAAAGMTEEEEHRSPEKRGINEFDSNPNDPIAAATITGSNSILTPPRSPARALPSEGYEKLSLVGEGTYGQVFKARAESSGILVALKKIRMESEKDGFPVTALREIKLLQSLKHENVVRLHEMMVSKGSFYMVFEYLEHDLSGVLNHPSLKFEPQHLKSLSFQLLSALSYLHKKSVLHRDLKCSNILLDNFGRLKIADFGLARLYAKRRREDYTNRVVTLWYRPPELLFGATIYGPEIDMWGAGCIFVELFTRRAIFAGNDELHQIQVITDRLGPVTPDRWPEAETLPWFELVKAPGSEGAAVEEKRAEQEKQDLQSRLASEESMSNDGGVSSIETSGREDVKQSERESEPQISLDEKEQEIFGKALGKYKLTPAALDVARALLSYDPRRRASAKEALEMDYFTTELPIAERPAGILSSAGGEWHEYESRLHKKSRQSTSTSTTSNSRKH